MEEELVPLRLSYGRGKTFVADLLEKRLISHHRAPQPVSDLGAAVRKALQEPIDFPAVRQAFVPGDRVAVVIDAGTPQPDVVFAELWNQLSAAGVQADDLLILQPAGWQAIAGPDPRARLPAEVRDAIQVKRHDATVEGNCQYLASTAAGERIYLASGATEADAVLTIGPAVFDPLLGLRGGASGIYPGLSDTEAIRRSQGTGHDELGPDDTRPLRQVVDEVGWLLGLQISICLIPALGTGVHQVLVGQTDSTLREARAVLKHSWLIQPEERAELVVVTVPEDGSGHGWEQVAAAIEAGRRAVERNGRILVLSQLKEAPGPGLEILKQSRTPRDAVKPIRKANVPDLVAATRIAAALDWANISLLSELEPGTVEDLFMLPVESEEEARRLLRNDEMTTILENAQHATVVSGI
ncbi:lactate racemase domain-containing protein [Planctomicrobium sp. SH664]|uniref:lactate racemase domain-containing protein n=1 Tax=Planctomicrobium sp. SH664 TaxID=3448125 RepID=UPI003F5B8B50